MKRLPLVLTLFVALLTAGLSNCEKEVEKIVEAEPAIQVDTITVESTDITQGQQVFLVPTLNFREDANVDQSSLQYAWFTDGGTIVSTSGDTAWWKAPSEDGVYKAIVQVTDGSNSGVGSRNLGVNVYTPGADVYYVGDAECANCHTGTHDSWAETGHADAWAGLQTSDNAASYCEPCHTVDPSFFEDEATASSNSGYDEVPVAKFEDVQCESCHGPSSDHIAAPSEVQPGVSIEMEVCGVCHDGTHHPYQTQWEESAHNFDPTVGAGAGARSYCQPCHSGQGFLEAYDTEYEGYWAEASSAGELEGVTCTVCHDPHSVENEGQLRTMESVTLYSGMEVSTDKAGMLCMQCHKARHSAEEHVPEGDEHFGPHYSAQADVVYGSTGNEDVATNISSFASSGHGLIEDACVSCHVFMTEYDPVTDFANVGHTFEPRIEACNQCHAQSDGSDFTSFENVRTLGPKDYDNDGSIEGLQLEVDGLLQTLVTTMVENFSDHLAGTDLNETPAAMIDSVTATWDDTPATPADSTEAAEFRKVGWNLTFVYEDGSRGVHNPAYAIQLLQQSILYLDPEKLDGGSSNILYEKSDVPAGLTAMK